MQKALCSNGAVHFPHLTICLQELLLGRCRWLHMGGCPASLVGFLIQSNPDVGQRHLCGVAVHLPCSPTLPKAGSSFTTAHPGQQQKQQHAGPAS